MVFSFLPAVWSSQSVLIIKYHSSSCLAFFAFAFRFSSRFLSICLFAITNEDIPVVMIITLKSNKSGLNSTISNLLETAGTQLCMLVSSGEDSYSLFLMETNNIVSEFSNLLKQYQNLPSHPNHSHTRQIHRHFYEQSDHKFVVLKK